MGLRVVAVDIDDSKLALATRLGAEVAVNAATSDVVAEVQKATGGVHGVLVTAVHPQAFGQALGGQYSPHSGSAKVTFRLVVLIGRR
jgi:propanol-preferring alcohol dehydrogenase